MTARKIPEWKRFEKIVAELQQAFDPLSSVTHNEQLVDKLGHKRQFDVVIRGKFAGHRVLGVIECKDRSRPVGREYINAFSDKVRNLGANLAILVSRRGFTEPALELAKHNGIVAFSLLSSDSGDPGFVVNAPAFAELYRWEEYGFVAHLFGWGGSIDDFELNGQSAKKWLLHQLMTTYKELAEPGVHEWQLFFENPIQLEGAPQGVCLRGFTFRARRTREQRYKNICWRGRGFYDWTRELVLLPAASALISDSWKADLSDWERTDSVFPEQLAQFEIRSQVFAHPNLEAPVVFDLGTLGEFVHRGVCDTVIPQLGI